MDSDRRSRASGEEGTGAQTAPAGADQRTTTRAPLTLASASVGEDTDDAEVRVDGYHYDDEEGVVELTANLANAEVVFSLTPDGAETFAEGIAQAARHAGEGSR